MQLSQSTVLKHNLYFLSFCNNTRKCMITALQNKQHLETESSFHGGFRVVNFDKSGLDLIQSNCETETMPHGMVFQKLCVVQ